MMSRYIGQVAGSVLLGLCVVTAAQAAPLFEPVTVLSRASAISEPQLGRLLSAPSTATVQEVRVDAAATAQSQLEFELLGQQVQATRSRVEALADGGSVWYGQIRSPSDRLQKAGATLPDDPANSVILVRSGNTLTGSIRKDGTLYRLRPLGDRHVLVEVDESRMPADHPADYNQLPKISMPANDRVGIAQASSGSPATIRVLVVATNAAVSAYGGNMQSLVQLAVAESNQGYTNSNVGITLQLAGYETTSYTESGNFSTDLARFRSTSDGYMDSIHTSRNNTAADVGVLLINNSSYCGLASGIGSTASTAFAAVYWDCATGYYSFAHEIGHLQSARHDIATDPSTSPYAYGHGYRYEPASGSRWRTIMAYACSAGCPRLNFWSNPNISYNGVPMGIASSADNQRVLVNTKATIAGFR
ncbi:zinc-dependent metalloprotease [Stenotrophomonas sp. S48]|uniref:zinc-dependent metalloprotease n=1 Tax=unclassified Stenotrophomonas TaxID=196198 RepID=UPI0019024FAE|nr:MULTISPECIES: zinc-dependent metalloprotease [unclassified Stenotrophomonas]MBK0027299.1 zinc-dependent metalloprotease [Stenotrophomonas sp. S48]MBK0048514.1 zinc-dependent metalloprotease [Stenotrophomonas sp. S49]